jgi:hypothetical protein
MNVEIGTEAAQFLENEYIKGIFVAVQAREYLSMDTKACNVGVAITQATDGLHGNSAQFPVCKCICMAHGG